MESKHETQFASLNLEAYDALDMAIFIKDLKSRYIWGNRYFINKSAKVGSVSDIYKKGDQNFVWKDYAEILQDNDQYILETNQSINLCERIMRHNGNQVDAISKKCPLFDGSKMIGLIGFSVELPKSSLTYLLSKREYAAVLLLSEGYTDKAIAKKWGISPRTVETYITNAKKKLKVNSRAQLIVKLVQISDVKGNSVIPRSC